MAGVLGAAAEASPWQLDGRSWLLVLLSADRRSVEQLGLDLATLASTGPLDLDRYGELESMEKDGLVSATVDDRRQVYALTEAGWAAARDALRRLVGMRRFLGVLEERYAVLCGQLGA